MEEKEFKFKISKGGLTKTKIITVKESELTHQQENFLLGDLINQYNKLPAKLQFQFIEMVVAEVSKTSEQALISLVPDEIKSAERKNIN